MRTQAHKLSLVLQNGNFRQVRLEELLDEIYKFKGESLHTKEEEIQYATSNIMKHKKCWEFSPLTEEIQDLLAFEKIRKFSENPYSLIDQVYKELMDA